MFVPGQSCQDEGTGLEPGMPQAETHADIYQKHRRELVNYATRLVVREAIAEELV